MRALLAVGLLAALPALAAPVAVATVSDVKVTLFDEPCAIGYVTNLPLRATWVQGDKVFAGCYAVFPESSAAGLWFDDGSVSVIPLGLFRMVKGA